MRQPGEKRISCKRCQTRKIKCSRTAPCRNCSVVGADCEFRAHDWKRSPISREHVTALEARIVALQSLLSNIKSSRGHERETIIGSIEVFDHQPTAADKVQASVHVNDLFLQEMRGCWGSDRTGSMCFYGPGSVFGTGLLRFCESRSEYLDHQNFPVPNISDVPLQVLQDCVELFFKWQYPYCNLIDQERFLREYSSGVESGEHYTPVLLHAVCSLGALMSASQDIRSLASVFSTVAEEELSSKFWKPHVTTSQAMLLFAVFEAGRGEFAKAWTYSGMAFRMVHQLGIHEYNSLPYRKGFQIQTYPIAKDGPTDLSARMFSLFFGRPSAMSRIGKPFNTEITPHSAVFINMQVELGRIIEDIQTQALNSSHASGSAVGCWVEAMYRDFNARLWNWHDSLPGEMRWNRWSSRKKDEDPGLVLLHMLFHTTRISLNRQLLSPTSWRHPPAQIAQIVSEAFDVCEVSVETIVQIIERFRTWYTLRLAPFVCVHGAIIAVDATVAILSYPGMDEARSRVVNGGLLSTLDAALSDLSQTWPVAQEARSRLHGILQARQLDLGPMNETPSSGVSMLTPDIRPDRWDGHAANPEPLLLPPSQGVSGSLYATQGHPALFPEYLMSASLEDASEPLDHGYDFDFASWNHLATSESGMAYHLSLMPL